MRKLFFTVLVMVSEYLKDNDEQREIFGISLFGGGLIAEYILNSGMLKSETGFAPVIIAAFAIIFGLVLMANDLDIVSKATDILSMELLWFMLADISLLLLMYGLNSIMAEMTLSWFVVVFTSSVYLTGYTLRAVIWLFSKVKKVTVTVVKKLKPIKLESRSETLQKVTTNLWNTVCTIGLFIGMVMPLLEKLWNFLTK